MKRCLILVAIVWLLVPGGPVFGQAISQVVFLPQSFFVGDMVEARVVVRTSETLTLSVPEQLPVTDWVTVHSVTIVQRADGFEVRIVFQPFFVGTRQLPTIGLGAMELSGISVLVNSVIGDGDGEPEPVRDQLFLPGTRLLLASIVATVFGVPLVIFGAGRWLRELIRRILRGYKERRPYRRLVRQLKVLGSEMYEIDGKRYYIRLLDEARVFFDSHYRASILSATTGELGGRLDRAGVPDAVRERIEALFRFGDLVKFAQQTVTREDRARHLEELRTLAQEVYKQRKHREGATYDVGA